MPLTRPRALSRTLRPDQRTLARLTWRLGIEAHPHGFRSSFRDWAAECTSVPRSVMEAALAHQVKDRTDF